MSDESYLHTQGYLSVRHVPPTNAVRKKEKYVVILGPEMLLINVKNILHNVAY
jgi:hypothetical protein